MSKAKPSLADELESAPGDRRMPFPDGVDAATAAELAEIAKRARAGRLHHRSAVKMAAKIKDRLKLTHTVKTIAAWLCGLKGSQP